MATNISSSNGWFWSPEAAPPSQRWLETGACEALGTPARGVGAMAQTSESRRSSRPPRLLLAAKGEPGDFYADAPETLHEPEPAAQSPVTYREYVYLVPNATEEVARDLLLAELATLRARIATRGQILQLAVCDIAVAGIPGGTPVAILTWKDGVGDPVIQFPRRR